MFRSLLFFIFSTFAISSFAQKNSSPKTSADTAKKVNSYAELISKAAKSTGFFNVFHEGEKYYLEIPDTLLGREILIVNRIVRAAADGRAGMSGYGGDEINENTVAFVKGPKDKIFLNNISYTEISRDSSADGMFRSVLNSNLQPIAGAFDIKMHNPDSSSSIIDITPFVSAGDDILFFDPSVKKELGLTAEIPDRSYIENIRAFPRNIEIHTVKTYVKVAMTPKGPEPPVPATYALNSSLVLLPKVPMKPRYYDERIGFFATTFTDFDVNPQGVGQTAMITRFRLEPKDKESYFRGELSEPSQPIIYYIDPATPKKWIPYLIQGVNDWNRAFEQAGFKNAIRAEAAPTNDSTWNLEDATHNAIIYKSSTVANASGPHVHDPRSGEIMETHINWYHDVMELLHNWFLIQTAAVDPRARKPHFDDSLMGQLIRFVVSHEVGHTLGLRHNFGSSSTVPTDSLRSKTFLEAHGHTPSIMDYARFDYVAQPEDNIPEYDLFPRIGAYDRWAIEWGYRWFPQSNESRKDEKIRLNSWVIKKLNSDKSLWFGTESDPNDPRSQNEDLSDNAMKAGAYGIKNLQRILPMLPEWTKETATNFDGLENIYKEVVIQFSRYMGHVAKNIGGIETDPKTSEQPGPVISFVPKAKQQEAMAFLQQQLFTTPVWLLDKNISTKTGAGDASTILSVQSKILTRLLNPDTFDKLFRFEAADPAHAYTCENMLIELRSGIWNELRTQKPVTVYRRNLQKLYCEKMILLIQDPVPAPPPGAIPLSKVNDQVSVTKGQINILITEIRNAIPLQKESVSKLHLQDCLQRLSEAMYPKK